MGFPEYIDRSEVVRLIAERTRPDCETDRPWKNKINGQIVSRIKKGGIATDNQGLLLFLDVSRYAKKKFPGKFDDWPTPDVVIQLSGISEQFQMGSIVPCNLPNDLERCHQAVSDLTIANHRLSQELAAKQAEIELLKPDAEWRQTFRKNSGRRT